VFLSRHYAYHGVMLGGTSAGGLPANRDPFGTLLPDFFQVGRDSLDAMREAVAYYGPERIAAIIAEPVIGAGGVIPPPEGYWPEVARILAERDVLLICDEVISGFGRLGTWFGAERYGVRPDLITCAKGLTSGYLPLGAVIASGRVREPFWAEGAPVFRHGYTYSAHPTACAAALANLDILEREDLLARVRELEPVLASALAEATSVPGVAEVRHAGLLGAIELEPELLAERPGLVDAVARLARENGVLTRGLRGVALQLSPPFVVSEEELRTMVVRLAEGVDAVVSTAA